MSSVVNSERRAGGDRIDVVGIGENSVDIVYRLPGAVAPNVKLPILSRRTLPGGQVATTLCACARLGLTASYVGVFGSDEHATLIRSVLGSHGVDTSCAPQRDAANRHAVILVDEGSGDRCILWQRDAALMLAVNELPRERIRAARVVHVDAVDEEAALAAARLGRDAGADVTTDIDRVTPLTRELLAAATFPILAADVPSVLTGESDPERALRALRARHPGRLCVTLGARGAMLLDADRLHHVPAVPVDAIDTTGAGDVFRGALIYSLLRGDDPETMLRFANAAAAISCTREGAIAGIPTLDEIESLLRRA
jgi:sugar/nucleoside kinase (ribokinase family)